jgi:hypothetical protein
MYANDPRSGSFNTLIYGPSGSGKTSLLRTARLPLHVDSFDPGGTKVLVGEAMLNGKLYPDEYAKGNIILDTSYEVEDPMHPKAAAAWDENFHRRLKMGYFDRIGTYAIDSTTTWLQDIMFEVLKKAGRTGGIPFQQDWLPQMTIAERAVRQLLTLPCDCILIGHDSASKDEATGKMFVSLLITGKLMKRIPLLFDEVYFATTFETSKGVSYKLLTRNNGLFMARSRLAISGKIDTHEPADIKALLKKAGLNAEDKPPLLETEEKTKEKEAK